MYLDEWSWSIRNKPRTVGGEGRNAHKEEIERVKNREEEVGRETYRHIYRQAARQPDSQKNRQIFRQTDRQTDKQTVADRPNRDEVAVLAAPDGRRLHIVAHRLEAYTRAVSLFLGVSCLSVCLSVSCLHACLSVCLSVCLLSACLSVCLSVCAAFDRHHPSMLWTHQIAYDCYGTERNRMV